MGKLLKIRKPKIASALAMAFALAFAPLTGGICFCHVFGGHQTAAVQMQMDSHRCHEHVAAMGTSASSKVQIGDAGCPHCNQLLHFLTDPDGKKTLAQEPQTRDFSQVQAFAPSSIPNAIVTALLAAPPAAERADYSIKGPPDPLYISVGSFLS